MTSIKEAMMAAAQTSEEAKRILRDAEAYATVQRVREEQRKWWVWSRRQQNAKA